MKPARVFLALLASAGLAAVIFTAARSATSDNNRGTKVPSDSEARRVLAQTFDRAKTAVDARAFCANSEARLICINQYEEVGGRPAVPLELPEVVESWTTPTARVLTVCGVDNLGKTYRADFPVRRDENQRLLPILEVFWNSKTYSGNKPDGEPVQASPRPQQFSC